MEVKSMTLLFLGLTFLFFFWSLAEIVVLPLFSGTNGETFLNLRLFFLLCFLNLFGLSGGAALFTPWPIFILGLSLTFWSFVFLQSLSSNSSQLFSHFTPGGLSLWGSLPMTLIELLGFLMRPLTLGMRLCANIAGGHLIGELLEEMGGAFFSGMMIHLYESFVSLMQGLIFSLLLFNYFKEI